MTRTCTVAISMERIAPEDGDYPRCGKVAVAEDPVLGFPMCEEHADLFELEERF